MNGCRKTPVLRCGLVAPYVPLRFFSKRKCAMNANGYRCSGRTFLTHIPTQRAYVFQHSFGTTGVRFLSHTQYCKHYTALILQPMIQHAAEHCGNHYKDYEIQCESQMASTQKIAACQDNGIKPSSKECQGYASTLLDGRYFIRPGEVGHL